MLFYCIDPAQCFRFQLYKCEGQLSIKQYLTNTEAFTWQVYKSILLVPMCRLLSL